MAGYEGWDIKTPKGIFPSKFIKPEGLTQAPNAYMDLDPRRTGKGLLVRNVLPYTATTIKITTRPMGLKMKTELLSYFPDRRKINITYWNEETNRYHNADFYMPEIEWTRYGVINNEPFYMSTTIELIGYGEKI